MSERMVNARRGRVVEIRGRRVRVRDPAGELVCHLTGHRVVVGDEVLFQDEQGDTGRLLQLFPRERTLLRREMNGEEQVLASHLGGLLIVVTPRDPPFRAGLVDRYLVAAALGDLPAVVVLNKVDLEVDSEVEAELKLRIEVGIPVLRVSANAGIGLDLLAARIAEAAALGPMAMVGHSGVGKTSLARALLPGLEVGPIGELSAYWGSGQHTTTASRWFDLPSGGGLVDSPGIRTFAPGGLDAEGVRGVFPGLGDLVCRYRDCRHRPGEDGCRAEAEVPLPLLESYRRLLKEIEAVPLRRAPPAGRPGGGRSGGGRRPGG